MLNKVSSKKKEINDLCGFEVEINWEIEDEHMVKKNAIG